MRCSARCDAGFNGDWMNEETCSRPRPRPAISTAAIGKLGPTLIFDHTDRAGAPTIVIDDATGSARGIPLSAEIAGADGRPQPAAGRAGTRGERQGGRRDDARHARRERRPAGLLRRHRHEGRAAAVQGPRKTVRDGVLVARSRRRAAQPGRQPRHARARHQRADLARRHPQRRRQPRRAAAGRWTNSG